MKVLRGLLRLILQALGCGMLFFLLFQLMWVSRALFLAALWGVMPLTGLVSAYLVTVSGINQYLAWIAPPAMGICAHYLTCFYLPNSPLPFFLCGVFSIVGAAAGDVVKKRNRKGRN